MLLLSSHCRPVISRGCLAAGFNSNKPVYTSIVPDTLFPQGSVTSIQTQFNHIAQIPGDCSTCPTHLSNTNTLENITKTATH